MQGVVSASLIACVPLVVCGWTNKASMESWVDTGFNGFLTLPPYVVEALDLPRAGTADATLADEVTLKLPLVSVGVEWDGVVRIVNALVAEGEVLIGMSLLRGHDVLIETVEGGLVSITRRE